MFLGPISEKSWRDGQILMSHLCSAYKNLYESPFHFLQMDDYVI